MTTGKHVDTMGNEGSPLLLREQPLSGHRPTPSVTQRTKNVEYIKTHTQVPRAPFFPLADSATGPLIKMVYAAPT